MDLDTLNKGAQEAFSFNQRASLPVLILHGSRDNVVDISESGYAQQQLKDYGYQVKLIELKGEKHNYPAYVSWAIINWFEKLEKQKTK